MLFALVFPVPDRRNTRVCARTDNRTGKTPRWSRTIQTLATPRQPVGAGNLGLDRIE
jgi:hypothetical protein